MEPKTASGSLWKRIAALPIRYVALMLLLPVLLGLALGYFGLRGRMERAWEQMDLSAMDAARAAAGAKLAFGPPAEEAYWFDARGLAMIPATEPPPEAYGAGTARRSARDVPEDYDPGRNYRGKVLRVSFVPQPGGTWRTDLEWVSAP